MSIPLPAVASMKPCLIQVAYGTRHTRSSSATRSWGIQKKGSSVQVSAPSNGGKTNTTAVRSLVQEPPLVDQQIEVVLGPFAHVHAATALLPFRHVNDRILRRLQRHVEVVT